VRVNLVVLRLAAVNGLHRERVAQDEGNALGRTHIGQPVPREHAFGRHDQILAVRRDGLKERRRRRGHIPVDAHLASGVEDADGHGLHVQIDPAVVLVLSVVESHRSSSCALCALALRQPTQGVGAGGGLYEDQAAAAAERRADRSRVSIEFAARG